MSTELASPRRATDVGGDDIDIDATAAVGRPRRVERVGLLRSTSNLGWLLLVACLFPLPWVLDDVGVYRVGLVLLVAISAFGLHVLVNWTGQVSLAHGAFVGLPSLLTADLASRAGYPLAATLAIGIVIGVAVGVATSLPALRVRGIHVAIVTLLLGYAIDRYAFSELMGNRLGFLSIPPVQLGPVALTTVNSLYPVLVVSFGVVLVVTLALERSKFRRGLALVRASEELADARAVPSGRYKILAFAFAGALAGLAGVLQSYWVTQVSPVSFDFSFSLLLLSIVVVAGPGSLLGVLVSAAVLASYDVPDWLPPIILLNVVQHIPGGLNHVGRRLVLGVLALLAAKTKESR